jgi:hypothetical protein
MAGAGERREGRDGRGETGEECATSTVVCRLCSDLNDIRAERRWGVPPALEQHAEDAVWGVGLK